MASMIHLHRASHNQTSIYQLVKVLIDCLHVTRFSKYNSNFNEISRKKKAFMYRDSIVFYLRDHAALLIIFFHYCITVLFVIMLYGKYVVLIEAPRSSRHNSVNQLPTLSSLMWAVCCFQALRRSVCSSAIGCIERNSPIQGICTDHYILYIYDIIELMCYRRSSKICVRSYSFISTISRRVPSLRRTESEGSIC